MYSQRPGGLKHAAFGKDSIRLMSVSADIMQANAQPKYTIRKPCDFAVCQVYYSPKKQIILLPASKVAGMTSKELAQLVAPQVGAENNNLTVILKSPSNFSLLLKDDEIPFKYLDALFFLPTDGKPKEQLRRYYLHMTNNNDHKQSHALIPVIDDKANILYMAPVAFQPEQFKIKHILNFLCKLHNISPDVFTAYDKKGNTLKEFNEPNEMIRLLIFNSLYLSFQPDEKTKKLIAKRVNVLQEFKDTELRYYKTLKGFEENVGIVFKKGNFLSKSESEGFLNASHYIISLHKQIYDDFNEMRIDYMTMIGTWFKKYVPFLKVYHQYVSLYKAYLPAITTAMNSRHLASVFRDFQNSSYANGLAFDSVLIIPVQRGPRYQLLLREVLKFTPETHPDYTVLSEALELTKDTLKKLEQDVSLVERRQKMVQLENWFSNKVTIFQPNRLYINTFFIEIKSKKYVFILFSDEFWMAKINGDKLVLDKTFSYSDLDVIKYAQKSVVLRAPDVDKVCLLETTEFRDQLVTQFRETSICFMQRQRNQIQMVYENLPQNNVYELAEHSMVYEQKTFWIFGGKNPNGQLNGNIYKFTPNKTDFVVIQNKPGKDPSPRFMTAMTSNSNGLYIFGGTTDGKTGLSDLWHFSFASNRWTKLPEKGDVPPPGYGYELVSYQDFLILSGGKDEFGIYKFIFKSNEWKQVQLSRGIEIMSLYGHSFVPIETTNGAAFIIGGKNSQGEYNDHPIHITKYGEVSNYVRLSKPNPNFRFQHRSVTVNDTIFVIGGDSYETDPFALQLSMNSWTTPTLEGVKQPSLHGFAMTTDGTSIFIHGGYGSTGSPIGSLQKVTIKMPKVEDEAELMFMSSMSFEKDNFVYNMKQNPKSVKDEEWV
ncbi:Kelch motif family protein [Tritrichomonas foetus]|uniref:Kelch motif family protein n=1 Tax=Tritrichomonas foetus TaxID=1144522 RepID=A0A1J4JZL3_9EUKA|nr:Kelch motif family protein [Tritrichomonas foetus]|eukprot:OHT04122.1 Kelch motif family protein [Tritrichomonas foetus]